MKNFRLIILFVITLLVAFQSVAIYPENSLKETETEESLSNEFIVVASSVREVKLVAKADYRLSTKKQPLIAVEPVSVTACKSVNLFLRHRSFLI